MPDGALQNQGSETIPTGLRMLLPIHDLTPQIPSVLHLVVQASHNMLSCRGTHLAGAASSSLT